MSLADIHPSHLRPPNQWTAKRMRTAICSRVIFRLRQRGMPRRDVGAFFHLTPEGVRQAAQAGRHMVRVKDLIYGADFRFIERESHG